MAKIKHNNFIDTVDEMLSAAKNEGAIHLYAEDKILSGRTIQINAKEMFHFATTSYLGLEYDHRLKAAAISAITKYGTQFPLSKTYISHPLYHELENKIEAMYGVPGIVTKNSTLGHFAVIPTAIRDEDGVLLDHQVHWSVQNACQLLKLREIPVEMIRHNNLQMLEEKIKELSSKCKKIWYMADGVYSMFGDYAPIKDLLQLCKKYAQLQLYFDDVHGMSWKGKNGTGYVLDILKELPENIMIVGTLSKTFGASGAVFITSDTKLRERIKNFGGPLTFSAQLEPASVAAASASADIHLSPEIIILQDELAQKITYFNSIIKATSLPMIAPNSSPVFFLGTAMPLTAYRLVQRLFNEGYFVNPGLYPAVPVKNSGIRITVSRNNQEEDIKGLVQALEYHFPKALEETSNTMNKVSMAFGISKITQKKEKLVPQSSLNLQYETSIKQLDRATWNTLLGGQSIFDWDGLCFLEDAFKNSADPKNNWSFHYYIISDNNNVPLLATFFTFGLWKDDMLAPESVSLQLEEKRIRNPFYLTSKVLGMGSLFTEGNHCYINKAHPLSKDAVELLSEQVEMLNQNLNADMLVLRDFDEDVELNRMFHNHGFIKINMPETCIIQNVSWNTIEEFTSTLSARSKKHFTKEILPFEKAFDITIKEQLTPNEIIQGYQLYKNVKNNNYAVNTFTHSIDVFEKMTTNPHWEFILLHLKNTEETQNVSPLVGILFCYKNLDQTYVPSLIGMDYAVPKKFSLYRQLLFQGIKRAQELSYKRIDFGITATFEKRKLGAKVIPKIAYIQAKDNFSMEFMGTLQTK
ncbi:aminotransferase class I/II-fold pyridoxal phosphate-dependent enzyme [Flavobacterium xinjiangense]|uniref:7-keto-8-aminopelargonate synthetase n=1 Tax=Flavobacterium xinjiangense TaxID=178356 RepID=A0A1M7P647_9FLAO|nr:aminotransferase class I/II-fold pyridoxal phosphate-dependent enzyme [Flavobacterium xinjiangense]SHN12019.1 7-keto-8-aminopelargonate synthetase [Flavobacterium xinjiangense]